VNQADEPTLHDKRLALMSEYMHSRHARECWSMRNWRPHVRAVHCARCALELEIRSWPVHVQVIVEDEMAHSICVQGQKERASAK